MPGPARVAAFAWSPVYWLQLTLTPMRRLALRRDILRLQACAAGRRLATACLVGFGGCSKFRKACNGLTELDPETSAALYAGVLGLPHDSLGSAPFWHICGMVCGHELQVHMDGIAALAGANTSFEAAALGGCFSALQWLRAQEPPPCPCSTWVCP